MLRTLFLPNQSISIFLTTMIRDLYGLGFLFRTTIGVSCCFHALLTNWVKTLICGRSIFISLITMHFFFPICLSNQKDNRMYQHILAPELLESRNKFKSSSKNIELHKQLHRIIISYNQSSISNLVCDIRKENDFLSYAE